MIKNCKGKKQKNALIKFAVIFTVLVTPGHFTKMKDIENFIAKENKCLKVEGMH